MHFDHLKRRLGISQVAHCFGCSINAIRHSEKRKVRHWVRSSPILIQAHSGYGAQTHAQICINTCTGS